MKVKKGDTVWFDGMRLFVFRAAHSHRVDDLVATAAEPLVIDATELLDRETLPPDQVRNRPIPPDPE